MQAAFHKNHTVPHEDAQACAQNQVGGDERFGFWHTTYTHTAFDRPKIVTINKKVERRDARREIKAETAARLEKSIEKELLARLKDGAYGDLYDGIVNVNQKAFDQVMEGLEAEEEYDEAEMEGEYEEEEDVDNVVEFVEGDSDDELQDLEEEVDYFQVCKATGVCCARLLIMT